MRFRLRTLLIVLGVAPPVLAAAWWLPASPFAGSAYVILASLVAIALYLGAVIAFAMAVQWWAKVVGDCWEGPRKKPDGESEGIA